MEFNFNVNEVFKSPIVEITHNLIPPGYTGDRRALWDTVSKVGEIVNQMGSASAVAQGLTKPITTADRIRNSEHKLYFLVDQKANSGKGSVTGMLKTGNKSLYVFDRDGNHYQVQPPCLLDFYVHESKQRNGLGKVLFEHMLQKEGIAPIQMAIDRPSDKLLGFLNKHYSLRDPVKQMNNYVVFDNFFPRRSLPAPEAPTHQSEGVRSKNPHNPNSANGLQPVPSPLGRYGAPRPPCSMGQIIHNQSPNEKRQEATGVQSMPATNYQGYQQSFSPENIAYISQSTPNMYPGQYQGQMQANYQNTPGQNWPQDPNITAQGYGATGQMIQGTTSAYPLQNQSYQNSAQNITYQNQNMGNYGTPGIQQNLPKEQSATTTYLDSYQLPAPIQSDKSNAVYAGSAQPSQMNITGYQYQQSPDPNAAQQQADNMAAAQQQAALQEATNAQQQATNMAAQQQAANVAAQQQQAANVAAQQQQTANVAAQQQQAANVAAQQQQAANVAAQQQQAANMLAQQQVAAMAAQEQAANMAAQQQTANMAAQQQAANMAAQQQAANMSTQQQSATLNAQLQTAAMAAQQQAAAMTAQQQAAAMAAQQQAAAMAAQQQAAAMAAQQQAAAMAAQQQAAIAAQQQVDMAAQEQAAYLVAQQQAANMAAQQQAVYKYAQGVGQSMEQLVPQQVRPQYSAPLLPSVTSQGAYQPVQGVQSAPIHPSHQMAQFGAVSPSAPSFTPNLVPSGMSIGHYNSNIPQVAPNFNLAAAGDQARRVMSAAGVPTYATPVPSKQEIVPNMQYPIQSTSNPVQNLQAQNSVEQMQNVGNQYTGGQAGEYARSQNQAQENYKECRPFSAEVCGADRFRVIDSIRKKNDGTDLIKKSTENDFKYGYPPQVSHDVQKAPEQSYATKLERPRSLIIQQEEPNKKLEKEDEDEADKDSLADSIDIGVEELDIEEPVKEKIRVRGTTENFLCADRKTPSPRKTPSHLTEQGYFDLKFYHNKLW